MIYFLKKYISDLTYGGTDGIIATFAIVAEASGANLGNAAAVIGVSSFLATLLLWVQIDIET